MPVRVPVNGDTLRWARVLASIDPAALAKAIGVSPERLEQFETSVEKPTYRQATQLAERLDRTLGFLLAPPPAKPDIPETMDFRGQGEGEVPAKLTKEIKRAEERRNTTLELCKELPALRLGAINHKNAAARAAEFRTLLKLKNEFVPAMSDRTQVFNFWRQLLEAHGVLVFQTTGIELAVFKGLSLEHETLPVVLVNGADAPNSKSFTLFHEMAHLFNRTSGLCELNESVNDEAVANKFAAAFLMPAARVNAVLPEGGDLGYAVDLVSAKFKVSRLAAAVRLRTLGHMDADTLEELWRASDEEWQEERQRQRQGEGFVPPWRLKYRDLGANYVGTVARALEEERVDLVDATYLLNARLPMVEQMLDEYYRTGGHQ